MKNFLYLVISIVFFTMISTAESATTIYYQDFDDPSFQEGDTFGDLGGVKKCQ